MPLRENLIDAHLFNCRWDTAVGLLSSAAITVSADMAIPANAPPVLNLDPGGANRTALLPAEADVKNKMFVIKNVADVQSEVLTIEEDSSTTAVVVLQPGDSAIVFCDGTSWSVVGRSSGTAATSTIGGLKLAKVALTATTGTSGGGALAWANPEAQSIIIWKFVLDVTTQSSGAATVDIGVAADATTSADTLIDGKSVATAGTFDNITDKGTNGLPTKKMTSSQYITGTASATLAGMVANAYIYYNLAP